MDDIKKIINYGKELDKIKNISFIVNSKRPVDEWCKIIYHIKGVEINMVLINRMLWQYKFYAEHLRTKPHKFCNCFNFIDFLLDEIKKRR